MIQLDWHEIVPAVGVILAGLGLLQRFLLSPATIRKVVTGEIIAQVTAPLARLQTDHDAHKAADAAEFLNVRSQIRTEADHHAGLLDKISGDFMQLDERLRTEHRENRGEIRGLRQDIQERNRRFRATDQAEEER